MASSASDQPGGIPISATTLASLVTTMEDLQKQVSQLREEKASKEASITNTIQKLHAEVAQFRQQHIQDKNEIMSLKKDLHISPSKGCTFTLFPKLPEEIRLTIWDMILYTPQEVGVVQYFKRPQKQGWSANLGRRRT
ncbi:hypothetical protein N431DRAFT_474875 [Stipitochalara longipes BDJ]|nr:hypothetical protein N431DRAFT_474875 [Stipitochalara longipes BDJ]